MCGQTPDHPSLQSETFHILHHRRQADGPQVIALQNGLPRRPAMARFLIARLFYTDGLNTLFAFGAIYAAGVHGMTIQEILYFGIAMNVTAGLGAAGFGLIEDRLGAKPTVLIALGVVMLMQPFFLWAYTWSFIVTLIGTVMFIITSHFPQ